MNENTLMKLHKATISRIPGNSAAIQTNVPVSKKLADGRRAGCGDDVHAATVAIPCVGCYNPCSRDAISRGVGRNRSGGEHQIPGSDRLVLG